MSRSSQIFQKRHFEFIARTLRETNASPALIKAWADKLRATNPEFKRDRFVEWASPEANNEHPTLHSGSARNGWALPDASSEAPSTCSARARRTVEGST